MTVPLQSRRMFESSDQALLDNIERLMRIPCSKRGKRKLSETGNTMSDSDSRSCIDRGTQLMVTIRVGDDEAIGIVAANGQSPASNVRQWDRWLVSTDGSNGRGLTFAAPKPNDYALALDFVDFQGSITGDFAELLTRGSIYMATRLEPESGTSWLSVKLGRGQSPRTTLAALRRPSIWQQVAAVYSDLIGRSVTERAQPWSVALPLDNELAQRGRIRVGSTLWGRLPENSVKSDLLKQQVSSFGGDPLRIESLYSLITNGNKHARKIGVAAEYDFENQTLIGAQYTLRVPEPPMAQN